MTVIGRSTAFSASYAAARNGPKARADAFWPDASNCGLQNAGWFGSLPITKCLTSGYERATAPAYEAKAAVPPSPASISRGGTVDGQNDAKPGCVRARDRAVEEAACPGSTAALAGRTSRR